MAISFFDEVGAKFFALFLFFLNELIGADFEKYKLIFKYIIKKVMRKIILCFP